MDFKRGTFRVRGDTVEVIPASSEAYGIRIELFGDEIDRILEIDTLTGKVRSSLDHAVVFPASHYVVSRDAMLRATEAIEEELKEQVEYFRKNDRLIEAQRIAERTHFDVEMMKETGFCSGIENYSRHLAGLPAGATPHTLFDYFPKDFILMIDESHMTVPQVRAMYAGDRNRKTTLVEYGFRLPSALDNRPLNFQEFEERLNQVLFVSATPSVYEKEHESLRVEQVIRPTGLLDPEIEVRPSENQIDDLLNEIQIRKERGERVLVTTLTKRMAEEMADYLMRHGVRTNYIHSEVKTLERVQILNDLRLGNYDVLVGVNLLREGLDLPEVSLVAILDADKEGFLRSHRSLTQTAGRAARNVNGKVIMYADTITASMQLTIDETLRRREKQIRYNEEHGITPKQIVKNISQAALQKENRADTKELRREYGLAADGVSMAADPIVARMTRPQMEKYIAEIQQQMKEAAKRLDFLQAAQYRDEIIRLQRELELK